MHAAPEINSAIVHIHTQPFSLPIGASLKRIFYFFPQELREEIEYALERRADREAERLRVDVHDGAVDLWGRVHSWQEKRAVIGSISHAPGVSEVRDHLRIDPYF